jgi:chemotaxis protein MotB
VASSRRRDSSLIWPGFVDAVTTLLMVLMFVVTIFTMMQAVLRDQITTQGTELDSLTAQVADLANALGLERTRAAGLEGDIAALRAGLATAKAEGDRQSGVIASLTADLAAREADMAAATGRISDFETQVAALLVERDAARGDAARLTASVADLEAAKQKLVTEAEAMTLALAQARQELDAGAEAARLAAARREALEALLAETKARGEADAAALATAQTTITEGEATRLADAAALQALRDKLAGADTELTAMTLALEAERKRAEETLTLLAAARLEAEGGTQATALSVAEAALTAEQEKTLAAAREVELLNQQVAALRAQLGSLQSVLDEAKARDEAAKVQLESLGSDLNTALAQVASEQRRRAELEATEAARLAAENQDLSRFRSEFFGELSTLLAGREGVRVVGDRFVFSSEVLFKPGSADLSPEGQAQIAGVVEILNEVRQKIPPDIDWIIRVDGHTDKVPLSGDGAFADNWELSQARALSVVRYMQNSLGFPPDRMAATGFGEYRPVAEGDSEAARAQNRRIELKLTER